MPYIAVKLFIDISYVLTQKGHEISEEHDNLRQPRIFQYHIRSTVEKLDYKNLVVHVAFLEVFDDSGLVDFGQENHVVDAGRLDIVRLPVVDLVGRKKRYSMNNSTENGSKRFDTILVELKNVQVLKRG